MVRFFDCRHCGEHLILKGGAASSSIRCPACQKASRFRECSTSPGMQIQTWSWVIGALGIFALAFGAGSWLSSRPVQLASAAKVPAAPHSLASKDEVRPEPKELVMAKASPIQYVQAEPSKQVEPLEETCGNAPSEEQAAPELLKVETVKVEPEVRATAKVIEPPPVAGPAEPMKRKFVMSKRLDKRSANELRKELADVPEVKLPAKVDITVQVMRIPTRPGEAEIIAVENTDRLELRAPFNLAHRLAGAIQESSKQVGGEGHIHFVPVLWSKTNEMAGMPFIHGSASEMKTEDAKRMREISRAMRTFLMERQGNSAGGVVVIGANRQRLELPSAAQNSDAIPCLMQMLPSESVILRRQLVKQLAEFRHEEGSKALAKLALFDLSPEIREQALEALAKRKQTEVRDVFLEGLNYPWAPVAYHAAEALVALDDREALPGLEKLLAGRDPCAPSYDPVHEHYMVKQLVRVNHLNNCVMCHAPSLSKDDPIRGRLPSPSMPLPPLTEYYESNEGIFVRADMTYLRQDFSVPQKVEKHGPWPEMQRFDYMLRSRPVNEKEAEVVLDKKQGTVSLKLTDEKETKVSPQREAVLFAIQELKGISKERGGAPRSAPTSP